MVTANFAPCFLLVTFSLINAHLWIAQIVGKTLMLLRVYCSSLCRKFVQELFSSMGVSDTGGYFAKELDMFDSKVRAH